MLIITCVPEFMADQRREKGPSVRVVACVADTSSVMANGGSVNCKYRSDMDAVKKYYSYSVAYL